MLNGPGASCRTTDRGSGSARTAYDVTARRLSAAERYPAKQHAERLEQAQLDRQPILEDIPARIRKVVVDELKRAVLGQPGPEPGGAILPVEAEAKDRGQVIDARNLKGHRLYRSVEQPGQVIAADVVYLMTQPDCANGGGTRSRCGRSSSSGWSGSRARRPGTGAPSRGRRGRRTG